MSSILDNLIELKNDLTDSTKLVAHEFSKKVLNVYEYLSKQIDDLSHLVKENTNENLTSLTKERDELKSKLEEYKKITEDKAHEARKKIVDKLHKLNEKIKEYNKTK